MESSGALLAERPAEEKAHADSELVRRFVALSFCRADMLFELDNDRRIRFSAGATPAVFGKTTGEMGGVDFLDLVHEGDRDLVGKLLGAPAADSRFDDVTVRLMTKSGIAAKAAFAGYRVPDFNNHFFLAVKIAPRHKAPREPEEDRRDVDSNILDGKAFSSVAAEKVSDINKAGGDAQLTLVKVDNLETFKRSLGHDDQHKLMSTIGGILGGKSLGGDTVGQIDEENFGIVHDKGVNVDSVGREIEEAAKDIDPEGAENVQSSVSTVDADTADLSEEQLARVITYTMQSFASGGASITASGDMSSIFEKMMADNMRHVEAFQKICATRNFDLVYMPICNLKTGRLHHFEALTRFRGNAADASPFRLITLAEEIGIISEFDLAVAYKCVNLVNKQGARGELKPIAINVSGHSIQNEEFVDKLHDLLRGVINLNYLITFEITESAEIKNLDAVNTTIQGFREKGFNFALDDFGAGAASFDYLNSFDVDTVKFDGPVVKRAFATEKGKAFLASMATLCNETGVETIAEMVEDQELADFLKGCGIHLGQGYFFGKPDPDMESFRRLF